MRHLFSFLSILGALAFLALAVGCATTGPAPQSSAAVQTESLLTSAGFTTKTPATARQQELFKTLTPNTITTVHRNGKTYYVYADPAQNQLYVGSPAQFQKYQQLRTANHLAAEQAASETTAEWKHWEKWESRGY
jgi:hypothetical protein